MTDQDSRVCAVCGRVLMGLRVDSARRWDHEAVDQPADHPAVPVHRHETHPLDRCDFCLADDPAWIVPARSFQIQDTNSESRGAWAACQACVAYIRANQWTALRRYVIAQMIKDGRLDGPLHAAEATLNRLWRQLRKNITGAPVRRPH